MIKYLYIVLLGAIIIHVSACNDSLEISNPAPVVVDTTGIISEQDYFLSITIGDTSMNFNTKSIDVANGVFKSVLGPCLFTGFDSTQYSSYFSKVADTNHNEIVWFGLVNCVPPNANGFADSTYVVGSYPMENTVVDTIPVDTARGFISYLDKDSVMWSSSFAMNGPRAQQNHTFNLTRVEVNYGVDAVLNIEGDFSGWIYNVDGDSQLVSAAKFNSKAWSL